MNLPIVIMGVSGSGKTTVGEILARRLRLPYCDGDDLHPQVNIDKMASGQPLTDDDRWAWLGLVGRWLRDQPGGGVIGCSALKRSYRDLIRQSSPDARFIHVHGPRELLAERMGHRPGHFMPLSLLDSQLHALEHLGKDECGRIFDVSASADSLAADAEQWLLQKEHCFCAAAQKP